MAVKIQSIPGRAALSTTGDLETVLPVPFDDDDRFFVCLSDGTLLLGVYDDQLRCTWDVASEGTGIARVTADGVLVDAMIEWVTASVFDAAMVAPRQPQDLPLFPELAQRAA